jgi:hypothetical protein
MNGCGEKMKPTLSEMQKLSVVLGFKADSGAYFEEEEGGLRFVVHSARAHRRPLLPRPEGYCDGVDEDQVASMILALRAITPEQRQRLQRAEEALVLRHEAEAHQYAAERLIERAEALERQ